MKRTLFLLLALFIYGASFSQEEPAVEITPVNIGTTSLEFNFAPNASCTSYKILISTPEEIEMYINMEFFGFNGDTAAMIAGWGLELTGNQNYTWNDMAPSTNYLIFALPYGGSQAYDYEMLSITSDGNGGTGLSVITIEVTEITASTAIVTCTPNAETAVFYDGIVTKDLLEEVGLDSVCEILYSDGYYPLYETDEWTWEGLDFNTEYVVIAFGKNSEGVWGDTAQYEFSTLPAGGTGLSEVTINVSEITETSATLTITPNAETALFYASILSKADFDLWGLDSVCNIIRNYSAFYEEEVSTVSGLTANTEYVVVALGMNANREFGDTAVYSFVATTTTSVDDFETNSISVYPMPNNGTFNVAGDELQGGSVMLYSITGQLLRTYNLNSDNNEISTGLPVGSYMIKVADKTDKIRQSSMMIIR